MFMSSGLRSCLLQPKKIGNGRQHNSNRDQREDIGNEIRVDHQRDSAYQGYDRALFAPVQKKRESDRAEEKSPQQCRAIHRRQDEPMGRLDYLLSLATSHFTSSIS